MVFDSKLEKLRKHFNIQSADDWRSIRPAEILSVEDVGHATLNHLRLYLAARGMTLANDGTPSDWQRILSSSAVNGTNEPRSLVAPFRIVIDVQEKHPFQFVGIKADSNQKRVPIQVNTVTRSLGPHHGDYSIEDFEDHIAIERKSMEDAQATFLAHGERRERWIETMEHLAGMYSAAIVIECSMGTMLANIEPRGSRSRDVLIRTLHRQVIAWADDYRVPFLFCDDRRLAEHTAFHVMRRAWSKIVESRRENRQSQTNVDVIYDGM